MAKSILQVYDEMQTQLGVDKIDMNSTIAKETPYSLDDTKNADTAVLTAAKFLSARGGELNSVPYSSTVDRSK